MKSKKLISFLCALAMTVSSFAGLAVTASAASEPVFSYTGDDTTGWTASGTTLLSKADEDGKYLEITAGGANSLQTATYALPEAAKLTDDYVIDFDTTIHPGNGMGRLNWYSQVAFAKATPTQDTQTYGSPYAETVTEAYPVVNADGVTANSWNTGAGAGGGYVSDSVAVSVTSRFELLNKWIVNYKGDQAPALTDGTVQTGKDEWVRVRAEVKNGKAKVTMKTTQKTLLDGVEFDAMANTNALDSIIATAGRGDSNFKSATGLFEAAGPGVTGLDNIKIYDGASSAPALDTVGLRGEAVIVEYGNPEKVAGEAPALAIPTNDAISNKFQTSFDAVTTGDVLTLGSAAQDPKAVVNGLSASIGSRADGDGNPPSYISIADLTDVTGGKALKMAAGQFATNARGPIVKLDDELTIESGKSSVLAFSVYLSQANAAGKSRLFLIDTLDADHVDGNSVARDVLAVLSTEDDVSGYTAGESPIGVKLTPDTWHTITVVVSEDAYRLFVDASYKADGKLAPTLKNTLVGTGQDHKHAVTKLPRIAVANAKSDDGSGNAVDLIDNVLAYQFTGDVDEKYLPKTGEAIVETPAPATPTPVPKHAVTIAKDGTVSTDETTAFDAVLVHTKYDATTNAPTSVKTYELKNIKNDNPVKPATIDPAIAAGDKLFVWSDMSGIVPYGSLTIEPDPAITGTVTVTGTPQVNVELTASVAGLNNGATPKYQWQKADTADGTYADINGATSATYTPVADDQGKFLKVVVTADGTTGSIASAATAAVAAATPADTPIDGTVTISGTAKVGETLTANVTGITPEAARAGLTYAWTIPGATAQDAAVSLGTASTLEVPATAVGKVITLTVTAGTGYTGSKSATTSAVAAAASTIASIAAPEASVDLLGKQVGQLGTLTYTADGTTANKFNATGELINVTGYTDFSSEPAEQSGYYVAYRITLPATSATATVRAVSNSKNPAVVPAVTKAGTFATNPYEDFVTYLYNDATKITVTVDLDGEGTAYNPATYEIDLSAVTKGGRTTEATIAVFSGDTTLKKVSAENATYNGSDLYGTGDNALNFGTATGTTYTPTGLLKYIEGWEGFSSIESERTGNYLPYTVTVTGGTAASTISVISDAEGAKAGNATKAAEDFITLVKSGATKVTVTVDKDGSGTEYAATQYTIDLSELTRQQPSEAEIAIDTTATAEGGVWSVAAADLGSYTLANNAITGTANYVDYSTAFGEDPLDPTKSIAKGNYVPFVLDVGEANAANAKFKYYSNKTAETPYTAGFEENGKQTVVMYLYPDTTSYTFIVDLDGEGEAYLPKTYTYSTSGITRTYAITGTVAVTGDAVVGSKLTATVTGLNEGKTAKYQWQANTGDAGAYENIADATANELTIPATLVGKTIKVVVTADGTAGSIASDPTAAVTVPTYTVSGTVDAGIATVALTPASGTAINGTITDTAVSFANVPAGEYTVTVTLKDGYKDAVVKLGADAAAENKITVTDANITNLAVTSTKIISVSGTVDEGVATVKLHPATGEDLSGTINGTTVTFADVPAGTYTLVATTNNGYKTPVYKVGEETTATVTVADADITNIAVTTTKIAIPTLAGTTIDESNFSTDDTWGFSTGRTAPAVSDGWLLLTQGNNAGANTQLSDVKDFGAAVSEDTELVFDYQSRIQGTKNRWSMLNVTDSADNVIFSLGAMPAYNQGVFYNVGAETTFASNTATANAVNIGGVWADGAASDVFRVYLHFVKGETENKISGLIFKVPETGDPVFVAEIPETTTTATDMSKIAGKEGYSLAPQAIDNVKMVTNDNAKIVTVTAPAATDGTLTVDKKLVKAGTVINITATPATGKKTTAIKVNNNAISGTSYTVTGDEEAIVVTAEFARADVTAVTIASESSSVQKGTNTATYTATVKAGETTLTGADAAVTWGVKNAETGAPTTIEGITFTEGATTTMTVPNSDDVVGNVVVTASIKKDITSASTEAENTVVGEFAVTIVGEPVYALTKATVTNGSIAFTVGEDTAATQVKQSQTLKIVPTPTDGYAVGTVSYKLTSDETDDHWVTVNKTGDDYTVAGSALTGDITVKATFTAIDYTITNANADVTVKVNGTAGTTAHVGDAITIVTTAATGKKIASVAVTKTTGGDSVSTSTSFTMPAADVTVTATVDDWNGVYYSQDFESGTSDFTAGGKSDGVTKNPADSTTQSPATKIIGIGKATGDANMTSPSFTAISGYSGASVYKVSFDFRIDACAQDKGSNLALLGGTSSSSWLNSNKQILTISAPCNGNGYFSALTINGADVKTELVEATGTDEIGTLNRNTTGWCTLNATINFETKKVTYSVSKGGSVVVAETTADFVNTDTTAFDRIFFAAGKSYGGICMDNILITTPWYEAPTTP